MTNEQAINQNVSFYPTDIDIVAAVQNKNGTGFSGAVRFIIREWARQAAPEGLWESSPSQAARPASRQHRIRKIVKSTGLSTIRGVTRGMSKKEDTQ